MGSPHLQLTLTGRHFTLTPLPAHLQSPCTAGEPCGRPASHRLLSRITADVKLLCDSHTIDWARDHGCNITSVSPLSDS
jgi:hypothetical protein